MSMYLSQSQLNYQAEIINVGQARGFSNADIEYALTVAFLESSLGANNSNGIAGNTSTGIYQYNNDTWASRHSSLNKSSNHDQITAFFNDISTLTSRYNSGVQQGLVPAGMTKQEYMYVKHHNGFNAALTGTAAQGAKNLLNNSAYAPKVSSTDTGFIYHNSSTGSDEYYPGNYDFAWMDDSGWGWMDSGSLTPNVEVIYMEQNWNYGG